MCKQKRSRGLFDTQSRDRSIVGGTEQTRLFWLPRVCSLQTSQQQRQHQPHQKTDCPTGKNSL